MSTAKWTLDPSHSLIEFSVKHMMIATVKGRFASVEGTIEADPADLTTAQFTGSVDVDSIDTKDAQRDGHLKSADFFDAANYPKLTFASKTISRTGDDYKLVADVTLRGVTREVVLDLSFEGTGKDPWGNERIGFSAVGKINRTDFGLNWNALLEAGGMLVGEQVKIEFHLEAIKQAAQSAA